MHKKYSEPCLHQLSTHYQSHLTQGSSMSPPKVGTHSPSKVNVLYEKVRRLEEREKYMEQVYEECAGGLEAQIDTYRTHNQLLAAELGRLKKESQHMKADLLQIRNHLTRKHKQTPRDRQRR